MVPTFDFIIVGGGTAGCLLAHRLSHANSRPSVLLVEAGGNPTGDTLRSPYYRFLNSVTRPDLDYSYVTVPQKRLKGRTIQYTRGKGLGGSSVMNFLVYLYGPGEDYNQWADLVGDESWRWEQTKEDFKKIENYHVEGARDYPKYADPKAEDHGHNGTVEICLPPVLEHGTDTTLDALISGGASKAMDFNNGNPVGVGVFPGSYAKDGRTTSATAHLINAPDNLTIWTDAAVTKLSVEGKRVTGIEIADGRKATSKKDVILTAGAFDSPRLMLLSGIGPAKELDPLGIKVHHDLPGVGKGLQDHIMVFLSAEVDPVLSKKWAFESNKNFMLEAEALWKKDKSGELAHHNGTTWGGFLKMSGLEELPEYRDLDPKTQQFLAKESVPAYEFCGNLIPFPPGSQISEGNSYLSVVAIHMNPQSRGSITLSSANPEDKPLIDMAYMEHPYDRKVFTESVRQTWTRIFESPELKKHVKKTMCAPKSMSDEDIMDFIEEWAATVWHANGTTKMGKPDDATACVDPRYKVYGIGGLRVADLSVAPLTTNNHTQSTAYLIGQKAADKIIAEYGL